MKHYPKLDANQKEIVKGLRDRGLSVQSLASIGRGCPDILVGYRGANFLLELKNDKLSKSQTELNEDQVKWHASWVGQKATVKNLGQALFAVGAEG